MILFEVNSQGVALLPFKGDTPRAVNVDRIAPRFALEGVKIEAGLVEGAKRSSRVYGIESNAPLNGLNARAFARTTGTSPANLTTPRPVSYRVSFLIYPFAID